METWKDMGLLHHTNTLIKYFLAINMMAMAALSFYQVVMRYAFNSASSWSEELVRFLFIWCTFVAAAIGVRERIHIGVDVFVKRFPEKFVHLTEIVVNLAIMVFSGYMVYYGWILTLMTRKQLSAALLIPMSWVYLSIPVMGILLLFYCSLEVFSAWKRFAGERRT
jgi:TRAP-type C4-dicarboxylate transport system permease small subunit